MEHDTIPIVRAKDELRGPDGKYYPVILLQPDIGFSQRYVHWNTALHLHDEIDRLKAEIIRVTK